MQSKKTGGEKERERSARQLLERVSELSAKLSPKGVAKAYKGAVGEMLSQEPSLARFARPSRVAKSAPDSDER